MVISTQLLAQTCKNMIETVLMCLQNATKGTIYRVGPMPTLRTVRITSGIRKPDGNIHWGLPEVSDYNDPGKTWEEFQDFPGKALEAMGWCVQTQKSWTADNPNQDLRSVRKQLVGEVEDFHHMEPVLVSKSSLYGDDLSGLQFPLDFQGKPIWQDTDYVIVAVIKIHFEPYSIKRGDRSTKIIKKLSRTLGTELLSLHIRGTLSEAQQQLHLQRMQTCNALAHEIRNALIKLGFIFSAINAEVGFLREQWENELRKAVPGLEDKQVLLEQLTEIIQHRLPQLNGSEELREMGCRLMEEQDELAKLNLLPIQNQVWFSQRIRHKWNRLLTESTVWEEDKRLIQDLLKRVGKVIWMGTDHTLAEKVEHLSADLKQQWSNLAYVDFTPGRVRELQALLNFLEHPQLDIPHKQHTKKVLTALKSIVEVIPQMEERTNRVIEHLKNGHSSGHH